MVGERRLSTYPLCERDKCFVDSVVEGGKGGEFKLRLCLCKVQEMGTNGLSTTNGPTSSPLVSSFCPVAPPLGLMDACLPGREAVVGPADSAKLPLRDVMHLP